MFKRAKLCTVRGPQTAETDFRTQTFVLVGARRFAPGAGGAPPPHRPNFLELRGKNHENRYVLGIRAGDSIQVDGADPTENVAYVAFLLPHTITGGPL